MELNNFYGTEDIPLDKVLVIELDDEPHSLDPAFCLDYNGALVCHTIWEPLLVENTTTKSFGGVAESFEVSIDKRVYRFHLHTDKKWSDGLPVMAQDFVTNFHRMFSLKSPVAQTFFSIENAEEIWNGKSDINCLGVKAIDTFLLEICFEHPIAHAVELFRSLGACPFPTHMQNKEMNLPVSNGPYVLKQKSKRSLEVHIHPYINISHNQIKQIRFDIHSDVNQTIERYKNNTVHITCHTHFPYKEIPLMSSYNDFYSNESPILFNLILNHSNCNVLGESSFRKLLSDTLDREELANFLKGGVTPCSRFVPKSIWENKINKYTFISSENINFETGDIEIPKEISIIYSDFYPNGEIVQYIKNRWNKFLGIKVRDEKLQFTDFITRVNEDEYDICLALNGPLFPHPAAYYLSYLYDMSGLEKESIYTSTLQEALETGNEVMYMHLEEILHEEMPVIPLCSGKNFYFQNPSIKGYHFSLDGHPYFNNLQWIVTN